MAEKNAQVLERGDLYLFVRAEVGKDKITGWQDVQRLYMIMDPDKDSIFREIVIPQKKLPDVEKHERLFGFVDHVFRNADDLKDELGEYTYETKTRGERKQSPARPVAEGRYVLADHDDHSHLAYALELPKDRNEVQKELNVEKEASYIISIRNPDQGSQFTDEAPDYPKSVKKEFGDTKFAKKIIPKMLDYEHAEFVLIGAEESPEEELDISLDAENETINKSELINELKLEKSRDRLKLIQEGKWD